MLRETGSDLLQTNREERREPHWRQELDVEVKPAHRANGELMSERQQVRVTVFTGERYDGNWPPPALPEFMAWFGEIAKSIPAEFRELATVELDSESGYEGEHYPSITVEYRRDETDEEMAAREAEAQDRARAAERDERRLLAALAAKYT